MRYRKSVFFAALVAVASAVSASGEAADPLAAELERIQHRWAMINYQTGEKSREEAFERLAAEAHALSERYPGRAEPLIWESIVLSSYAGSLSGLSKLGALEKVKKARDLLLAAEKIRPDALDGSVYTSLGALYYKVPGWPFGFGDEEKAREYLDKAVQINPDGIDPNFFLGELLYEQGKYAEAVQALQRASQASPRPNRAVADRGRHEEIRELLARAKASL